LIPSTLAAVVAFLLLLAPGIVWELQRARFQPAVKETALIEASRIVLASMTASLVAAVPLLPFLWVPLYEMARDADAGLLASPVAAVPYMGGAVTHSLMACGLVLAFCAFKWPGKAPIVSMRVWHLALEKWRPTGSLNPNLVVELLDGTIWRGSLLSFDAGPEDNQRCLALGQPLTRRRPEESAFQSIHERRHAVILAETQIKSIQVSYPAMDQRPGVEATTPALPPQKGTDN
jgi:hypothetical protein